MLEKKNNKHPLKVIIHGSFKMFPESLYFRKITKQCNRFSYIPSK